jgi:hypothetical protein
VALLARMASRPGPHEQLGVRELNARDYRKRLAALAKAHGYTIGRTRNDHLVLTKPGRPKIFTSWTPSSHRVLKNVAADLKRAERQA